MKIGRISVAGMVSGFALARAGTADNAADEVKGGAAGGGMAMAPTPTAGTQAMHDNAAKDQQTFLQTNANYWQSRFYPNAQINNRNVSPLHVAWLFQTDVVDSLETSPIVVNGVMY